MSKEFNAFLASGGIKHQFIVPYTPQQNGVVERKNGHIVEIAHALMNKKSMPLCYWTEVVFVTMYVMNRTPTTFIHDAIVV